MKFVPMKEGKKPYMEWRIGLLFSFLILLLPLIAIGQNHRWEVGGVLEWVPAEESEILSEAERMLELAIANTDKTQLARYWFLKGLGHFASDQAYLAENAFRNTISTLPEDENLLFQARLFLGRALYLQSVYIESEIAFKEAMIMDCVRDKYGILGKCYSDLGKMVMDLGEPEIAREYFEQAAGLFFRADSSIFQLDLGFIWLQLSEIALFGGRKPEVALAHAEKAIACFEQEENLVWNMQAFYNAIMACLEIGNMQQANALFQKCLSISKTNDYSKYIEGYQAFMKAELAFANAEFALAEELMIDATGKLVLCLSEDRKIAEKVWKRQLAFYAKTGDIEIYERTKEAFFDFMDSLAREQAEAINTQLKILYGAQEKDSEIQLLNARIAALDENILGMMKRSRTKSWWITSLLACILSGGLFVSYSRALSLNKKLKIKIFKKHRALLRSTTSEVKEAHDSFLVNIDSNQSASRQSEDDQIALYRRAQEIMEKDKLYLKSDLTIEKLAQALNSSVHQISNALNTVGHVNVNAFINKYRVNESIRLIKEVPEDEMPSFSDIATMSGFKSYSTFYRVFKQITSLTPRAFLYEYRKGQ